jgi:hypothetical protein
MKLARAAALLALFGLSAWAAPASAQSYTFAGTSWGDNMATTKEHITDAGFEFTEIDDDGDASFDGTVMDYPSRVYAMFNPKKRLVKVSVLIATPDDDAITTYKAMVNTLVKKYGDPLTVVNNVKSPYKKGQEQEALADGKGTMASLWGTEETGYLVVQVTEKLAVRVAYEGPDWSAESDRRTGNTSSSPSSSGSKPSSSNPF